MEHGKGVFVELRLDTARVGVPLHHVERVLRAAWPTPVPGAPGCLLGMLDLAGEPLPVYDTRRMLGLPARALRPDDRLVVMRDRRARAAFVADEVSGVIDGGALAKAPSFAAHAAGLRGVTQGPDGMVFIHDLTRFMALERAIAVAHD